MDLIAVCPPEYSPEAASYGFTVAHACYSLEEGELNILKGADPKGGIMLIGSMSISEFEFTQKLFNCITDECKRRRFSGVFFDISKIRHIKPELFAESGIKLYLPDRFLDGAVTVVSSAISGGNFETHLRSTIKAGSSDNIALGLEFTRMDFTLPEKSGCGQELSRNELNSLFAEKRGRSFFSEELCSFYFRYSAGGKNHMVLFNNEHSLKRKLTIAEKLGFSTAFFYYPEFRSMKSIVKYQRARPCE